MGAPAGVPVRLVLDHHYPTAIAVQLRAAGHDAHAAIELGWEQEDDESLLERCAAERRTLLTNNVADFAIIARTWSADGRSHPGLIFTSDDGWPRTRSMIGRFTAALDALMTDHPAKDAFDDQVHWL